MADRISPLSNALLARILSFLQMKDVVKTSILSWRWKYVWWKVPVFDLFGLGKPLKPSFIAFVYRALVLNDVPVLLQFCLDRVDEIEDFHLNSWIWSVMERNVWEISLSCSIVRKKRLVKALFSSEMISYRYWSSTIRKLEIACASRVETDIVIEAPRLEFISLTEMSSCYDIKLIGTLPCLLEVIFDVNCPRNDHHCGIIDLLRRTSKLTTLKLAQSFNDTLEYHRAHLPIFRNLVFLERAYAKIPFILQMLDLTLNLASLILRQLSWTSDDQLPGSIPECLSRTLKVVEINDFCGYGSHSRLAEYILTHAAVLKVMRICTAQYDSEFEVEGLVQLFMVRKASRHCEFHICIPPED